MDAQVAPTTTADAAAIWATRHARAGADWAARYWASWRAPHREHLEQAWHGLQPATVLELGANAGPNLRRAAQRWPSARLVACDVNPMALAFLQRAARADGWADRLTIRDGDLCAVLPSLPSRSIDLVFAVYTLAYVAPDDLDRVLAEVRRVTRGAGVLYEPMTWGASVHLGVLLPDVTPAGWAHNYVARLSPYVSGLTHTPMVGPDGLNGIVRWEERVA